MIATRTEQVISVHDWDDLVVQTYGRPYCFQQQDGCKERQRVHITTMHRFEQCIVTICSNEPNVERMVKAFSDV